MNIGDLIIWLSDKDPNIKVVLSDGSVLQESDLNISYWLEASDDVLSIAYCSHNL